MTGTGGSRRIWLCADDYGISPGVNAGIRDLIVRERLNATSVMVVAPTFGPEEAQALSRTVAQRPGTALGLHVTLTAPFRPLTSAYRPARDGAFLPLGEMLRAALLARLDPAALTAEVEAQLVAFVKSFKKLPDFLDGHQHVQLFPQVRDAILGTARRLAPGAWVRQCGQIGKRRADPKGLLIDMLSRGFRRRADTYGVATNPAFAGTYAYTQAANFGALMPRFLAGMPEDGVVMCHPGFVDDELKSLDPLTDLREREHAYLAGDAFPQALSAAGVHLFELVSD